MCIFCPKFHCELNPIERQAKKHTKAYADGTITKLRKIVPESLDSVTVNQIKKCFNTTMRGHIGMVVPEGMWKKE